MATATTLTIHGYRDEPVPNRFLRPEGAIDHLAVLLPGFGYTLDMPLFYYAENLLLERGWDVLRVEYAYNKRPEFQDPAKAGTGSMAADRYDGSLACRSRPANLRARRPDREVSGHPGHGTPADHGRPASHRGSRLADATAPPGTAPPADLSSMEAPPCSSSARPIRTSIRSCWSRCRWRRSAKPSSSETRTTVWIFREIPSPPSAPSSAWSRPSAGSSNASR